MHPRVGRLGGHSKSSWWPEGLDCGPSMPWGPIKRGEAEPRPADSILAFYGRGHRGTGTLVRMAGGIVAQVH